MLAQARWTSLSEADGLAWVIVPGLNELLRIAMFVCALWAGLFIYFPNYKKVYACVCGVWTWWTKSIGFWDVLGMGREWEVCDRWTACGTWTISSPEVLLLGWMSEGVHFTLNLGMLWPREFIVGKAGMRSGSERGVQMTGEGVREAGLQAG